MQQHQENRRSLRRQGSEISLADFDVRKVVKIFESVSNSKSYRRNALDAFVNLTGLYTFRESRSKYYFEYFVPTHSTTILRRRCNVCAHVTQAESLYFTYKMKIYCTCCKEIKGHTIDVIRLEETFYEELEMETTKAVPSVINWKDSRYILQGYVQKSNYEWVFKEHLPMSEILKVRRDSDQKIEESKVEISGLKALKYIRENKPLVVPQVVNVSEPNENNLLVNIYSSTSTYPNQGYSSQYNQQQHNLTDQYYYQDYPTSNQPYQVTPVKRYTDLNLGDQLKLSKTRLEKLQQMLDIATKSYGQDMTRQTVSDFLSVDIKEKNIKRDTQLKVEEVDKDNLNNLNKQTIEIMNQVEHNMQNPILQQPQNLSQSQSNYELIHGNLDLLLDQSKARLKVLKKMVKD